MTKKIKTKNENFIKVLKTIGKYMGIIIMKKSRDQIKDSHEFNDELDAAEISKQEDTLEENSQNGTWKKENTENSIGNRKSLWEKKINSVLDINGEER